GGGKSTCFAVFSREGPADADLVLERTANPAAKQFLEAIFKQGIPITAFEVDDIRSEFDRLKARRVLFTMEPAAVGPVLISISSDTCGNLIQLYQPNRSALLCQNLPPPPY